MSTSKHIDKICVIVLVFALLLTVVFMNGSYFGIKAIVNEDDEDAEKTGYFTSNDLDCDWENASVISIDLSSGKTINSGAYFYNNDLIITLGGYYELSGNLEGGSIKVVAEDSSKVFIKLNGATVTNDEGSCIVVENADKTFITLEENTENILTDGESYSNESTANGEKAVIFSRDDLTINGTGNLTVSGSYYHGIECNDELCITNGNISITSPQDGIHTNDSVRICKANIQISANDDGIHCDDEIIIVSGTITVNECYEGIEAVQITILDGDITVYSSDDGINANGNSGSFGGFGGFGDGKSIDKQDKDNTTASNDNSNVESDNDAEAPEIPNGDMSQGENGETPEIPSGDMSQGENGEAPEKPSGNMSQGENGETPEIPSDETGEIPDMPSDDFTPGEDDSFTQNKNQEKSDDSEPDTFVLISGGNITIYNETGTDADGIDSNGDIIINGGNVFIFMTGTGSNCALDYGSENGGSCTINGGSVVACGGSSMLEEISTDSTQPSITCTFSNVTKNSQFNLCDADGNELVSCTIPYSFSAIIVSTEGMEIGNTYSLSIGDNSQEIELTDVVTTTVNTTFGGMGGGFNNLPNQNPQNNKNKSSANGEFTEPENDNSSEEKSQPDKNPTDNSTDTQNNI